MSVGANARSYAVDGNLTPNGDEQITGLNTVKTLTPPTDSRIALLQAEDQDIRWRDNGQAPTSSVGMILGSGLDIIYVGNNLAAIQFIETTASAKLNVSYYK